MEEIFLGYVADVEKYSKTNCINQDLNFVYKIRNYIMLIFLEHLVQEKLVAATRLVAEAYTHVRRGEQGKN